MKVRRLTPDGVAKFAEFLNLLEHEPTRMVPTQMIEDPECSEVVAKPTEIQSRTFGNRYAAAQYLEETLSNIGIADVESDVGLWSWLTLLFFEELCPKNKEGERNLRERPAYIPEPQNYTRYYRHLLLGPYKIFRAHRDDPKRAMALLCQPLHIIADIVGQLAAYQEIVSNKAVVEMATELYLDMQSGQIKRGAGGKGPGSPRRLATIIDQFDVTWDLYAMSAAEFLNILPKEFEKFRHQ